MSAFCLEALDGALELVRADGGEIAALDFGGTAMVTRARRKRPPHLPGFGAPSRPSQPVSSGVFEAPDLIDSQVTQLLPSAQMARAYAPNQGLVGVVWTRREAMQIRFDANTIGAADSMLVESDALHHLAVPIFRPDTLNHLSGRGPVIGVLRVFNRDELWSYTAHDKVLLELHADRLGRALALLDTSADSVRRGDVVRALRDLSGVGPTVRDLLTRVAETAALQINAQTFTALFCSPGAPDSSSMRVELALRSGTPLPGGEFVYADLPPWLQRACTGDLVRESAPQGGSAAVLASLGWTTEMSMRSALAAPLVSGGRIGGAFVVTSPQPDAFNGEAAAIFEALTLAAATFVENARLVENAHHSIARLAEQRQQLSALNNAVQTLNASLDVDATLKALAEQASLLTSAQVCAVFLRDEGSDALVCRAVYPEMAASAALLEARIPLDWRKMGARLTEGAFVLEEGVMPESADSDTATAKLARVGVTAFLAAPISHQDRHLGALVIYTPRQSHRFSPDEIGLLQGLASQAAIAISNARLYAELGGAYEQLKELDRLKDDFILTVSHEFRTPLTAIEGYVTLINKHGHRLDQEKLQQFATEIHQATMQLAGMISMLADANRLSTQPLRIAPRPLNLRTVAADAAGAQAPEAKDRIQIRIADDLWVNGDDERLPLIFSNLISNAIKYAGIDKPCRVTARVTARKNLAADNRKLSAPAEDDQEWVVVTVEDEGPGISIEDQARLFQKFVRLAQSLVTPVRGTGLGLWICRQYVEAMGGDIWVDSRPGQGARFSFCLPRIPAPSA
ncbi:MAG TPA: ATP-binding protein [Ktedonobacterales bacterium]|nr:ATP-binding protein [Ktedonobacterales bacterium]